MFRVVLLGLLLCPILSRGSFQSPEAFEQNKSDLKVLIFLSEKCPCSRSHVAHLNKIFKEYPGVGIYGVISAPPQTEKEKELVKEYFSSANFDFPLISDPKQVLVRKYKALKTPHVTMIKEGKVIYQGGLTSNRSFKESGKKFLEENLLSLKLGKALKHKNGRCLGCYIRRY